MLRSLFCMLLCFSMLSLHAKTAHESEVGQPASAEVEGTRVKVQVNGLEHAEGRVLLMLVDCKEDWKAFKPAFGLAAEPAEGSIVAIFENIPAGEYGICVFHDENANEDLDRNFMGLPREPFGFSNDRGRFGPPSFKRASFTVGEQPVEVPIALRRL